MDNRIGVQFVAMSNLVPTSKKSKNYHTIVLLPDEGTKPGGCWQSREGCVFICGMFGGFCSGRFLAVFSLLVVFVGV